MKTLTVHRDWGSPYAQQTTLKDEKGKTVEIISSSLRQPKKGTETIELVKSGKKIMFKLDWNNV